MDFLIEWKEQQIISINFEDVDNEPLCDCTELYEHVKGRMLQREMNYIFLDEIQHVAHYEKAVDSLFVQKNADVYITGSNAYFMSGELAPLLSGRYVELKMLPLSFAEYMSAFPWYHKQGRTVSKLEEPLNKCVCGALRIFFVPTLLGFLGINTIIPVKPRLVVAKNFSQIALADLFRGSYIYNSSFPYTVELKNRKQIHSYLDSLYNTVVLNDIVERKRIQDPAMLKSVIRFPFNITSEK